MPQARDDSIPPPQTLAQALPVCALDCVASILIKAFPPSSSDACTTQDDLACYCTRYSSTGYSLGEVALACAESDCSSSSAAGDLSQVYRLCDGRPDSVQPTHAVVKFDALLPVPTPPPSQPLHTQAPTSTPPTKTPSHAPAPPTANARPNGGTPLTSVPTNSAAVAASSVSDSTSNAPESSLAHAGLKPAQTAAVAAAVLLSAALLFALFVLCSKLRRKRLSLEGGEEAAVESEMDDPSPVTPQPLLFKTLPDRPANRQDKAVQNMSKPYTAQAQTRRVLAPTTRYTLPDIPEEHIGIAISPELHGSDGIGTASAVFPLQHQPERVARLDERLSNATQVTVFEEENRLSSSNVKRASPQFYLQPAGPFASESKKSPPFVYADQLSEPDRKPRPVPRQLQLAAAHFPDARRQRAAVDQPPMHPQPMSRAHISQSLAAGSRNSVDYIPRYYMTAAREIRQQTAEGQHPNQYQGQKSVAARRTGLQKNRMSYASDTSFESLDSHDITPPEAADDDDSEYDDNNNNKPTSPPYGSPLSNLKYPRVPRPSNQRIARGPPSPQRSPSKGASHLPAVPPRSLLMKRRGDNVARGLEDSFHIAHSHTSSLKSRASGQPGGDGTDGNDPQDRTRTRTRTKAGVEQWVSRQQVYHQTQMRVQPGKGSYFSPQVVTMLSPRASRGEMELKSAIWTPESYPNGREDDLFLSVT